ncbi:transposase [Natrinema halophilum]|uniref:transposase n=1 Tax=Natrinema halophilum TaxID=1699371 RepID=UPI003CCD3D16
MQLRQDADHLSAVTAGLLIDGVYAPFNCLKQDGYYFSNRIARCDDSDSEQATRLNQKKSARRTHYFHTLSKHIVERCVDEGVGTIVVGDLSGNREDEENGESKNWGNHGNLDLHSWAFVGVRPLHRPARIQGRDGRHRGRAGV